MVTARLAIGSVSTLALGALLLGSAPYWLNRHTGGAHATPWGDVSPLGVGPSVAAQSDDDRAKLLKLAAMKSGAPADPVPVSAPAPAAEAVPQTQPASMSSAAPQPVSPQPVVAETQAVAAPQPDAPSSQQVASLEDASPAAPAATDDAAPASDRININTASSNVLDHLPGAGRIGHAIVSHRPYKNVKDLVNRRVLRTSDFQKIQAHISVD